MMFLLVGIRAEVEPVPRKRGWYQLTGKRIQRTKLEDLRRTLSLTQ